MFKQNKYTVWYFNIVHNAIRQNRIKTKGIEKHHIIPKSIGGSNDASNLVLLTAREHYVCHLLLPKMCINNNDVYKMSYAFFSMKKNTLHKGRYTSKLHQIHREAMIRKISKENSVHWKRKKSDEQVKKMVETRRRNGCLASDRNGMFGKKHTFDSKILMSERRKAVVNIDKQIESNPFRKALSDGIVTYRSLREASRVLGVHRRVISKMVDEGSLFYV
jgi:hypothetical protein